MVPVGGGTCGKRETSAGKEPRKLFVETTYTQFHLSPIHNTRRFPNAAKVCKPREAADNPAANFAAKSLRITVHIATLQPTENEKIPHQDN